MTHLHNPVNTPSDAEIAEALANIEADAHDDAIATWTAEFQCVHTSAGVEIVTAEQHTTEELHTHQLNLRREREALRAILRGTERHLLSIERGEVVALTPGLIEDTKASVQAQRERLAELELAIQEAGAQLDEMCDTPPAREPQMYWHLDMRVGNVRILTRAVAGGGYETCARKEGDGRLVGLWRWAHRAAAERGHHETLRRIWHALLTHTELRNATNEWPPGAQAPRRDHMNPKDLPTTLPFGELGTREYTLIVRALARLQSHPLVSEDERMEALHLCARLMEARGILRLCEPVSGTSSAPTPGETT